MYLQRSTTLFPKKKDSIRENCLFEMGFYAQLQLQSSTDPEKWGRIWWKGNLRKRSWNISGKGKGCLWGANGSMFLPSQLVKRGDGNRGKAGNIVLDQLPPPYFMVEERGSAWNSIWVPFGYCFLTFVKQFQFQDNGWWSKSTCWSIKTLMFLESLPWLFHPFSCDCLCPVLSILYFCLFLPTFWGKRFLNLFHVTERMVQDDMRNHEMNTNDPQFLTHTPRFRQGCQASNRFRTKG